MSGPSTRKLKQLEQIGSALEEKYGSPSSRTSEYEEETWTVLEWAKEEDAGRRIFHWVLVRHCVAGMVRIHKANGPFNWGVKWVVEKDEWSEYSVRPGDAGLRPITATGRQMTLDFVEDLRQLGIEFYRVEDER